VKRGVEKSDAEIVPAKCANKTEQSAAECVEGSGAKTRNAELQSTVRTQSREAVSQAQNRIREAITRDDKGKLTALLHHMTVTSRNLFRRLENRSNNRSRPFPLAGVFAKCSLPSRRN
jgi:hypothetical protein